MMPLKEHYKTNVITELKEKLELDSIMAVPKVTTFSENSSLTISVTIIPGGGLLLNFFLK